MKSPINITKEELTRFFRQPIALTGDHLAPTKANLQRLARSGVTRIVLLVRDPRDALVSWQHHLLRDDIRSLSTSALGVSDGYYTLSEEEQFEEHIEKLFPWMQKWLAGWAGTMDGPSPFAFHLVRFEDFAPNPRLAINGILRFFGYAAEAVLPNLQDRPKLVSAGIDPSTHFRRGIVGSHRDELSPRLLDRLNMLVDTQLFARYRWEGRTQSNHPRQTERTLAAD